MINNLRNFKLIFNQLFLAQYKNQRVINRQAFIKWTESYSEKLPDRGANLNAYRNRSLNRLYGPVPGIQRKDIKKKKNGGQNIIRPPNHFG